MLRLRVKDCVSSAVIKRNFGSTTTDISVTLSTVIHSMMLANWWFCHVHSLVDQGTCTKKQDAMTYVRHYGRPNLFITFTCNSKWTEITQELFKGQKPNHRHDIIACVFRLKLNKLMVILTKQQVLGPVRCYMYSIEWQKRGLPHAHILLWLREKIPPSNIDSYICAEIPDPHQDPQLYEIVTSHMVHGPCGSLNQSSPCMKEIIKDGRRTRICFKNFPKACLKDTQTGHDGYSCIVYYSCIDGILIFVS